MNSELADHPLGRLTNELSGAFGDWSAACTDGEVDYENLDDLRSLLPMTAKPTLTEPEAQTGSQRLGGSTLLIG